MEIKSIFSRYFGEGKCKRSGHVPCSYVREGYYKGGIRAVITRVTQEATKCKRCGEQLTDWETTKENQYQSFSAPESLYDKIAGHYEDNPYWYSERANRR